MDCFGFIYSRTTLKKENNKHKPSIVVTFGNERVCTEQGPWGSAAGLGHPFSTAWKDVGV